MDQAHAWIVRRRDNRLLHILGQLRILSIPQCRMIVWDAGGRVDPFNQTVRIYGHAAFPHHYVLGLGVVALAGFDPVGL
jgi:hypothetical protein